MAVKNVLLVDDDRAIRGMLLQMFKASYPDLHVSEAASPDAARQIWRKVQPGLIFLDLYLPAFEGLNLLAEIKKEAFKTSVVVVTGSLDDETGRQALSAGAWDFISKPFDLENLKHLVDLWLATE